MCTLLYQQFGNKRIAEIQKQSNKEDGHEYKEIFKIYYTFVYGNVDCFFITCNGGGRTNDISPPDDVSDLKAVAGDFNVSLVWNEPGNADFSHTEIS